jgi:hypothetical protein
MKTPKHTTSQSKGRSRRRRAMYSSANGIVKYAIAIRMSAMTFIHSTPGLHM